MRELFHFESSNGIEQTFVIDRPVQKLLLVDTTENGGVQESYGAKLDGLTIEATLDTRAVQGVKIIERQTVNKVAYLSSSVGGRVSNTGDDLQYEIMLALQGNIVLSPENAQINFTIKSSLASTTIKVFAIESPVNSKEFLKYDLLTLLQSNSRTISTPHQRLIAMKGKQLNVEASLKFSNGFVDKINPEKLAKQQEGHVPFGVDVTKAESYMKMQDTCIVRLQKDNVKVTSIEMEIPQTEKMTMLSIQQYLS